MRAAPERLFRYASKAFPGLLLDMKLLATEKSMPLLLGSFITNISYSCEGGVDSHFTIKVFVYLSIEIFLFGALFS